MGMRRLRASALAGLLVAGLLVAPAFAQAPAAAPPPANRLALVIGEAAYNGDALPTAGQDAALIAQTLGADGFDVTELHDLNTPDLAAKYQAFLAKVAAAPPGAAVTVYLAGLGVAVGCDDYLLPVDAEIRAASDVPPIALSMTRVMNDLAQTSSQLRLVMLDGARPIPPSVSAASFPRGLIPLNPPAATTFGISAEIHDFEAPPKQGDANDAYASAFALVAQQPLTDVETAMRQVRVVAHQATSGAQTPWQATNIVMPPFTFPLNADPAQMQAAAANLPSSTAALSTLDVESAYWAAIWRNSIPDYQAYLAAFSTSAPADEAARITQLLALLQQPNPQCQAAAAPPPPPPLTVIAGPACPDGFVPQDGFNGAYCVPLAPPPVLQCPPGFSTIVTDDGMACSPWIPPPVLTCPPFFHVFGAPPYCVPDQPPPFCPPGFRPIWHDGVLTCVRGGPLPPAVPSARIPFGQERATSASAIRRRQSIAAPAGRIGATADRSASIRRLRHARMVRSPSGRTAASSAASSSEEVSLIAREATRPRVRVERCARPCERRSAWAIRLACRARPAARRTARRRREPWRLLNAPMANSRCRAKDARSGLALRRPRRPAPARRAWSKEPRVANRFGR